MISAVVDARLEQRLGNFNTNRQQNNPFPIIEAPQPHQEQQPSYTPYEQPHVPALRAEEVGYFDPEYQQEQGSTNGPVVNAGKYVYYRDVYVFVDRLKDLAVTRNDVKSVMTSCFRGSALMWYSMELTELERDLLRDTDLNRWYTTLIDRFKTRTSVALSQLVGQTYSLTDMKFTSPRAFIQQMLHLAKSAEFHSTYNQLTLLWNQFAVNLRRDIPEPRSTTTISQFLEQVNSKTPIWMELAQRQSQQRPWQGRPAPHDPAPVRYAKDQKGAPPLQQPSRHVTFEDRKGQAYLAEGGYDEYENDQEQ